MVVAARAYARMFVGYLERVGGQQPMERFDVVVIGGGGTGSEVAFSLARSSGMKVALAERDKLGGECNHYGCVPTKVMLRSAKIAALARDGARFGLRIPEVEVDLKAVQQRARDVIDAQSGEGAAPFERVGVRVFLQEARLLGERRVELADGTEIEADKVVLATGTEADPPRDPRIGGWALLDEPGSDLGAAGRSRLAGSHRHRRDRHRVRAAVRAVRLARHGAGGPSSSPPAGRRGSGRLARARPRGRGDHGALGREIERAGTTGSRVDGCPRGRGSRDRR